MANLTDLYNLQAGLYDTPDFSNPSIDYTPTPKNIDTIKAKEFRLSDRLKQKQDRLGGSNRDANDLTVANQDIINNLKGFANYLLPESREFNKYEYDAATDTDYILNEDTNERIATGYFDNQGEFISHAQADIDSPLKDTRVAGLDSLENHLSTDYDSKFQKIRRDAGVTQEEMLSQNNIMAKLQGKFDELYPNYTFKSTGEKDYSGKRDIIYGDEYKNFMLANGGAVPARDASKEDWDLYNDAKKNNRGVFSNETGHKVADATAVYNQFDSDKSNHDNTILGRTANVGKAFATSIGGQVVDLADLAVETIGGDLGTDEEKTKYIKEFVGYDSHYDERAHAVAANSVDRMAKYGVNTSDVTQILGLAFSNPEMLGTSLGYVLPMAVSGPVSVLGKASKAYKAVNAAKKAGKIDDATHAARIANIEKSLASSGVKGVNLANAPKAIEQYKAGARAADLLSKNAGILAFSAGKANDDIEARVAANNGEDLDTLTKTGIYFTSIIYNSIDKWSSMGILKSPEVLTGVKAMIKATGEAELKNLAKSLSDLTKATARTTGYAVADTGKEATTEGLQEIMDIIVTEYKTKSNMDDLDVLLSNNAKDIAVAAGMGAAGATQFTAVGTAKHLAGNAISAAGDRINQNIEEEAPEAAPVVGKFTQMVQDVPLDESKAAMESAVNELQALAKAEGKDFKEVFAELPQEEQDDFTEANRQYKLRANADFAETGNSDRLGATPDEEFAIIKAYADLEDDAKAAKFEVNILKAKANDVLNEGDITIQEVMEKAKEVRAATQQLTKLENTRTSVVTEGLTDQLKGFTQYFKEALANEAGSTARQGNVEKLLKFMSSQDAKRENLLTGQRVGINKLSDEVTKILGSEAVKKHNVNNAAKTIDHKTILLAMAGMNGLMVSDKNEVSNAVHRVKLAKIPEKNLMLDDKITKYDYASENFNSINKKFNREKGTFEYEYKSSLRDILEDEGYTPEQFNGKWKDPSSAQTTIEHISREINAMSKAVALVEQNTVRKTTQENGSTEPMTDQTPEEDTTTSVKEEKAPEASGEEKRLAKLYNIAADVANGRPLSKKDTEFAKNNKQAITKLIKEDENLNKAQKETRKRTKTAPKGTTKPPKEETVPEPEFDTTVEEEIDVAALNEEVRNTPPESQNPTQEASKESEEVSVEEEVKESPKPFKQTVKAGTDFVQNYINSDVDSMTFEELINFSTKSVGLKNETKEVVKTVEDMRKRALERLDTMASGGSISVEKRDRLKILLTKMQDKRSKVVSEINQLAEDISNVSEFLDETSEVISELNELYKEREDKYSQDIWNTLNGKLSLRFKKVKGFIKEFHTANNIRNSKGKIVDEDVKFSSDTSQNYGAIRESLNKQHTVFDTMLKSLAALRKNIVNILKGIVDDLIKAKKAYNETAVEVAAFKKGQSVINARIDALENYAESMYGTDWRSDRKELFSKFKRTKQLKSGIERASKMLKATSHTTKVLTQEFHKDSAKSKKPAYYVEKKKIQSDTALTDKQKDAAIADLDSNPALFNKSMSFNLAKHLKASNATSILGSEAVSDEIVSKVFFSINNEVEAFAELAGINPSVRGNMSKNRLADYPHLMLLNNKDNTLNTNTFVAVKAAVDMYVAENYDTLGQLSPENIESIYGLTKGNWQEATQEQITGGIPSLHMVDTISKNIGNMLGIKAIIVKDADGKIVEDNTEVLEKVLNGLALAGIKHAEQNLKLLKRVEVPTEKGEGAAYSVTYKLGDGLKGNLPVKISLGERVKEVEELLLSEVNPLPVLHTEPRIRELDDIDKRREPMTEVSDTVKKAIIKNEQEPWTASNDVIDFMLKTDPANLRKLLGYSDPKETNLTKDQQIGREGKNRQIEADIANLEELSRVTKAGMAPEGVFFRWFVASNGRQMIDAKGGVNPQSIKLHRYSMTTEGQRGTVSPDTADMTNILFKLGFAQALGYKIDKNDISRSIEFADSILNDKSKLDRVAKAFQDGESSIADLKVKIKEPAHAASAIVEGYKFIKANGKPFDTVMTLEIDGLTNGFAHKMMHFMATDAAGTELTDASVDWLRKVGFEFKSKKEAIDIIEQIRRGIENKEDVDGIVDAYLTLGEKVSPDMVAEELERAIVDEVEARFNKGEEAKNSGNEYKATAVEKERMQRFNTEDLSQIKDKVKAFLSVMPNLRDDNGDLTDFARDLLKYPFMTFGYGAGDKSISNNMAASLIDDAMQMMLTDNSDKPIKFLEALGVDTSKDGLNKFRESLKNNTYNAIRVSDGRTLLESFRGLVLGVYGDAVADVMESEFGGMKDINTSMMKSTDAIFKMFQASYDHEKSLRGIPKDVMPSKEIHTEIMDILKGKGLLPVVMGPDSAGYEDGVALYKETSKTAHTNEFGDAKIPPYQHDVPVVNSEGTFSKNPDGSDMRKNVNKGESVRSRRKSYESPGVKVVVMLTQYADALGTARASINNSLLQVFDAYVLGVGQSSVISEVNEDFVATGLLSEWTQTRAVADAVKRTMENMQKNYPEQYEALNQELEAAKKEITIEEAVSSADKIASDAETRREAARKGISTSQQFAFDKDHGFEYNGEKVLDDQFKDDIKQANPAADADAILKNIEAKLAEIEQCTL